MKTTLMQEKILTAAESLIQKLGYNAFSYKDIASIVGIKTSSIHYYYPSKEDLAVAVIDWQLTRLSTVFETINYQSLSLQDKLLSLVDAVLSLTLHDDMKMCLGGMLASDVLSLPEKVNTKVRYFFNILEKWINKLLNEANFENKSCNHLYSKENLAKHFLVQLEGGLLLSRIYKDFSYVEIIKQCIKHYV